MDTSTYIKNLFTYKKISFVDTDEFFEEFVNQSENQEAVKAIFQNQNQIMANWTLKKQITDIQSRPFILPNGTAGKDYKTEIDFEKLGVHQLGKIKFEGLEELGLSFDYKTNILEGIPNQSGNLSFILVFKLKGEEENEKSYQKVIPIVINPDPKSLWKDLPSNQDDLFWKEDNAEITQKLGEKNLVVASKRGRSHKNTGGFREDDFAFKHFEETGWSVVAVSDGAGSASLARKGSNLACQSVIEFYENYFENGENPEYQKLENTLVEYQQAETEEDKETKTQLKSKSKVILQKNILETASFVHNKIKEHAENTFKEKPELFDKSNSKTPLEHYHATLIFALFKKYDFGFVLLTFGVGDCPIAILNKNQDKIELLNKLDVGEFGGGTRFITQSSIFTSQEQPIESRFNLIILEDFSYLFLMTDGIYDAKFEVEANLEKIECWKEFLEDLQGKNEDETKVEFDPTNEQIASQLSQWTDFWSLGNHDDRTLAIIY